MNFLQTGMINFADNGWLFGLLLLIWSMIDIVKCFRHRAKMPRVLRTYGQMGIFIMLAVYLLFVCGPMIVGLGCCKQ